MGDLLLSHYARSKHEIPDSPHRFRADPPAGMAPGTPFGPGIRSLLMYLHHSHHVSFERLSRIMAELFGLSISEGAIGNAFRRLGPSLGTATRAIAEEIRKASVVASDETTTRVNGATQWQWTFICDKAVLHAIAPRRAKAVAEEVMAGARPRVWISDRYAGQQDLAEQLQVMPPSPDPNAPSQMIADQNRRIDDAGRSRLIRINVHPCISKRTLERSRPPRINRQY
jgi:hypothetical protein